MTVLKLSKKQISYASDCFLIVKDNNFILQNKDTFSIFCSTNQIDLTQEDIHNLLFVGELYDKKVFALEKRELDKESLQYVKVHDVLDRLNPEELKTFYRSCYLLNWHHQSRFCGTCGSPMRMDDNELAKVCESSSHHRYYPQYSPSMIVLVRHEHKLLLGRSAHFPTGMYSTLAGFIEAGETVEEAVQREVMEEVGIAVKNIRPITTAPWPFPNTLMLAYEAEALSSELTVDPEELEDAQWFAYDNLPQLPPKATIAYQLIERGVERCQLLYETEKF